MIEVHITQNSLTVKGHAGYAERGKDIVCAAVSALAQGLVHSLSVLTDDEISAEIKSGILGWNMRIFQNRGNC